MDDLVKQALAKWPDVPDCTGWLALDARGRWRIGEAKDGPRQPITNAAMNAFINRNYQSTGRHWIFQNGPQRVFVELEYTPFVWRLVPRADGAWDLVSHIGEHAEPRAVWLDEVGRFLVEAKGDAAVPMIGVVHDHDTAIVAGLLRTDDGEELDDEAVTQLASSDVDAAIRAPCLRWTRAGSGDRDLVLQRIASPFVAQRFAFEPKPSIALKVDVDTRR